MTLPLIKITIHDFQLYYKCKTQNYKLNIKKKIKSHSNQITLNCKYCKLMYR